MQPASLIHCTRLARLTGSCLLLALFSATVQAEGKLDSLLATWNDAEVHDSLRLNALDEIAWDIHLFIRPDSAFHYASIQYAFAERTGRWKHMLNALNTQGASHYLRGDLGAARERYEASVELARHHGDKRAMAKAFNNLALVAQSNGAYDEALELHQQSLAIEEELENAEGMAASLSNIGKLHDLKGNYPLALDHYMSALRMAEAAVDTSTMANCLLNAAQVHEHMGETPQALELLRQAIALRRAIDDRRGLATAHNNLGIILMRQGDLDSALFHHHSNLELREAMGDASGMAYSLNNIGQVHLLRGDHQLAMAFYQRSLRARDDPADKLHALTLTNVAEIHLLEDRKADALKTAEQAHALATRLELLPETERSAEILFRVHEAMGNSNKALAYFREHVELRDSLRSEEKQKEVMRQQFQYDFEKKEALVVAEQEKRDAVAREQVRRREMQRNLSFAGSGVLILVAGIILFQRNRIRRERDRSDELLLNILPYETAKELKEKGSSDARLIDEVTVLFTDFKGFTAIAERLPPAELVAEINDCFSAFDRIMEKHGVEKIKTIGDAYMAAGGLPTPNTTHATDVVGAALEMCAFMSQRKEAPGVKAPFEIRVGVHTGPVVAGIVGIKKFQYDIWGDTVNLAARMESSGEVGRVNISASTQALVKDSYHCTPRGSIEAKGKGRVDMWFVAPPTTGAPPA